MSGLDVLTAWVAPVGLLPDQPSRRRARDEDEDGDDASPKRQKRDVDAVDSLDGAARAPLTVLENAREQILTPLTPHQSCAFIMDDDENEADNEHEINNSKSSMVPENTTPVDLAETAPVRIKSRAFVMDDEEDEDSQNEEKGIEFPRNIDNIPCVDLTETGRPVPIQSRAFVMDDDDEDAENELDSRRSNAVEHIPSVDLTETPDRPDPMLDIPSFRLASKQIKLTCCSGKTTHVRQKPKKMPETYEQMIAARSAVAVGRAQQAFYGIDIHKLVHEAKEAALAKQQEEPTAQIDEDMSMDTDTAETGRNVRHQLWTETYRARKFVDLVGDERTHRSVLGWLKSWDPIVFPGAAPKVKKTKSFDKNGESKPFRKILLLTGPPGLGKTTLAHVCARQAGYEVQEINASDERSRDVVNTRIRDMVGTENVRQVKNKSKTARPLCVVVDEVDGVVAGNASGGSGEGGFIKALLDLLALDAKNSPAAAPGSADVFKSQRKKDGFRLLRPLVLICNDAYVPALRALRTSGVAEIVHVRKPPIGLVTARLQSIFAKEGIAADGDGVRRLCDAAWGITGAGRRKDLDDHASGDVRSVLVTAQWACRRLGPGKTLTRQWVDQNVVGHVHKMGGNGGAGAGARQVAERVFLLNAGFLASAGPAPDPASQGMADSPFRRLREAVESCGEDERIMSDVFAQYASQPFQDDTYLTKPCAAADWACWHDTVSSRVRSGHEWELAPYMSAAPLAFYGLFAAPTARGASSGDEHNGVDETALPFSGLRAGIEAAEAEKLNRANLEELRQTLSLELGRGFSSVDGIAAELVPALSRLLCPAVKPVVVRDVASVKRQEEKDRLARAVEAMVATGVRFDKVRVDGGERPGLGGALVTAAYRMEPELPALKTLAAATAAAQPTTYGLRAALAQECSRVLAELSRKQAAERVKGEIRTIAAGSGLQAAGTSAVIELAVEDVIAAPPGLKPMLDFFGRVKPPSADDGKTAPGRSGSASSTGKPSVWIAHRTGYSNAVRKPLTLAELLAGM